MQEGKMGRPLFDFMFCQFTQLFRQYMRQVEGTSDSTFYKFYFLYLKEAAEHFYSGKPLSKGLQELVSGKLSAKTPVFLNVAAERHVSDYLKEVIYPEFFEFSMPAQSFLIVNTATVMDEAGQILGTFDIVSTDRGPSPLEQNTDANNDTEFVPVDFENVPETSSSRLTAVTRWWSRRFSFFG